MGQVANPKKKTAVGKKTAAKPKKAANTSVRPQTIYPDYKVWLKKRSWSLEDTAWLLVGLDPAIAGMDLPENLQEELNRYEITFGKHDALVDQYRTLIGDLMVRRASREWIIGKNGDFAPERFLQWCFDHHVPWHERLQNHLDETGRTFRYSDDSDMLRSIKRLVKQDSWLLWEAALLTLGFNPDMTMTILIRRPNLQLGRDHFERDALARASYLADTARGSWRAGKLEIVNDDEVRKDLSLFVLRDPPEPQAEVFPKPFLLWAQDKGYAPPVQLLEELGLAEKKRSALLPMPEYTTPYLEMMKEVILDMRLSETEQSSVKEIAGWFSDKNKTINGEELSERDKHAMASLVRLPKSRQGGTKPMKKSKTS